MNDRLHLSRRHRRILEALIRQHLPGVEVWAYGSRVNGRSHDGSDLDLVLRGPGLEKIPTDRLANFEEALRESTIPFLVEARDWARLPERFHREIEREYVVLSSAVDELDLKRPRLPLNDLIDLRLSSVDKKSKPDEIPVRLCNYTDVYYNSTIRKNMAFMAATASDREIAKCALSSGDVVITKDSEKYDDIGVPAFVMDDVPDLVCGYHLAILRPSTDRIYGRYLFYALSTHDVQTQFHYYANGITRFGLRKSDIGLVEVPLPCMEEQRAIAHLLGALDDKIELNRRMNETLEAMARAIFKDWFIDFGPTRARAEDHAPYLTPELWELFPDALDDTGKPTGWEFSLLGERIEILDSKRIPLSSRERQKRQGSYPYHGATGVMDYVDDFLFEGVHVLLGEDGSVVRPNGRAFTQYVWGKFWVNNHAHVLKGKDISDEMLLCFLQQVDISPYVTGAVQPKLNQKNLKSIPFSASGSDTPMTFQRIIDPIFERFRHNSEENRTLTQIRDFLLPKLMSGEIRLQDAEEMVEIAA